MQLYAIDVTGTWPFTPVSNYATHSTVGNFQVKILRQPIKFPFFNLFLAHNTIVIELDLFDKSKW